MGVRKRKGKARRVGKRKRKAKRTVTTMKTVRTVVSNPRPTWLVITARKGATKLTYDGRHFSRKRPKKFVQLVEAFRRSHQLRRRYVSALRGWHLNVEIYR
jgi:hypothetical protein